MLDPKLNPQEQPFLFHESNKNSNSNNNNNNNNNNNDIGRPRSHERYEHESSWDSMNYAFRAQNTAQNYANYGGARSPSPPGSPRQNHYRSMSPASRAQAIARGQRELMEMVSNMPESCYELSLKDLVEHGRQRDDGQNDASSESMLLERRDSERRSSFGQDDVAGHRAPRPKVGIRRFGATETNGSGHLLKMGFSVPFGSNNRAKKKATMKVTKKSSTESNDTNSNTNSNTNTTSLKVSANNNNNNSCVVDKEWWKKRYSVGGGSGGRGVESDQSGIDQSSSGDGSRKSTATTSSSSGSRSSSLSSQNSGRTNPRRGSGGCWWFIGKKKSRDVES